MPALLWRYAAFLFFSLFGLTALVIACGVVLVRAFGIPPGIVGAGTTAAIILGTQGVARIFSASYEKRKGYR